MKKRFDAMTVISIILLALIWIGIFISGLNTNSNSCDLEFDDLAVLPIIFEHLFGGITYASNTFPQAPAVSLNNIMRSCIRNYRNDSVYLVHSFSCISDNKIY